MHIADTLSRLKHDTLSQSCFEKDIKTICNIEHQARSSIAAGQLQELKEATSQEETLSAVSHYIKNGWPDEKREVPRRARPYFNYREELVLEDGIVLKGTRLVIPAQMRKDTLHQLHRSHMGVEATKHRVRDTVF